MLNLHKTKKHFKLNYVPLFHNFYLKTLRWVNLSSALMLNSTFQHENNCTDRMAPFTEDMKFITQISPLLNFK